MFKNKKKGDIIFYRSSPYSRDITEFELTVTKVTNEFIYAEHVNGSWSTKFKFDVNDGCEILSVGSGGNAYPSKQYYLDLQKKNELGKEILKIFKPDSMEISELEEMIVSLNKINNKY